MEITDEHWSAFRYANQEKKSFKSTAELIGVTRERVKELLAELRKAEPSLFPYEKEKYQFGAQNMAREGRKMLSYNQVRNIDSQIKQKF